MATLFFAAAETEDGPRAELKITTPNCMAADVFDPCSSCVEFEAHLDSVQRDLQRVREEARRWFARHRGRVVSSE